MTDREEKSHPPNPLKDAGILSRFWFAWAWPLLNLGATRPIQELDLPELDLLETSAHNCDKVEQLWRNEMTNGRHNLGRALFWDYLKSTWWAQMLLAANMTSRILQALALGLLMEQFGNHEQPHESIDAKQGYFSAALLVVCGLIAFPCKQQQFFETYRKGIQLRLGLVAAIYAKTLRLPSVGGANSVTSGHLTNLASNDVERFLSTSVTSVFLLLGPFEAIAILIVGISVIGPAFAVGYGLLFLLLPLQMYLSRRFVQFRSQVAAITDNRVSLVSQAVSGVRVMKLNGWELEFNKRISKTRSEEVAKLQNASRFKALNEACYYFTSLAVSVFIFTVHILMGGSLTPRNVFTTMTLLNIVQFTLTKHVPNAVMGLSECYVSCKRIQAFFELPERIVSTSIESETTVGQEDAVGSREVLSLSGVTCYWNVNCKPTSDHRPLIRKALTLSSSSTDKLNDPESLKVALSDISLTFKSKELYCIIGKVGSGKSALLQTLAEELPVSDGQVTRNYHSLSYATQDPWIMDGSVRENIVMGLPFNEDWYRKVLEACGLVPDIADFSYGDLTVVGDRGVQCSGGQKARIGLARALYRDSEVLILDDPLSAVDSKVARSIYYSAIHDLAIKRGKCVVLVTHQHQFVGNAACCILLDSGKVVCCGTFADSVACSNGDLSDALQIEKESHSSESTSQKNPPHLIDTPLGLLDRTDESNAIQDVAQSEKRDTGIIRLATWSAYGKALGGMIVCTLFFFLFSATQACLLVTIVTVGYWAEASASEQYSPSWLSLVGGLTFGVVILAITRAQLSFFLFIKASQRLHNRMLRSVLRAKIEFFDTNPLGRILNRFSADVGIIDEALPLTIYDFLVGFFMVLGGLATAIVVLPFILVVLPPLIWYFLRLRRIFVSTTRELKRLEGMARSPIFAMMSESLNGIATIRSNDKVEYFKTKFEEIHDAHTRAFFSFAASSRWFATQMDFLAFILMSMASLLAVLFNDQGWFEVDPAILGLALTILIQIATTNFPWMVRQSAEMTNQMVSVERILSFGSLPLEAPLLTYFDGDHEDWPKNTSVVVNNLTTRYRSNLPPALSGVSFKIEAGQRVGVVGRTGSGKSSLVQALFRILEAEEGSIEVGGVDISLLGLHTLRTSMAVIPQSPVLFSGCTVRENLDPFGKCDEANIRHALGAVQMSGAIDDLPHGLDTLVAERGSNFSVGQRQLLCLARAILLKKRILVLDEPTANVDTNTDQLLQQTLKEKFSEATIISVAHRLDTIIDYDRILVLSEGKVLEYGSPRELLSKEEGHFASMVRSTGESMAEILHEKAKLAK